MSLGIAISLRILRESTANEEKSQTGLLQTSTGHLKIGEVATLDTLSVASSFLIVRLTLLFQLVLKQLKMWFYDNFSHYCSWISTNTDVNLLRVNTVNTGLTVLYRWYGVGYDIEEGHLITYTTLVLSLFWKKSFVNITNYLRNSDNFKKVCASLLGKVLRVPTLSHM